jgi:hypothetical protein
MCWSTLDLCWCNVENAPFNAVGSFPRLFWELFDLHFYFVIVVAVSLMEIDGGARWLQKKRGIPRWCGWLGAAGAVALSLAVSAALPRLSLLRFRHVFQQCHGRPRPNGARRIRPRPSRLRPLPDGADPVEAKLHQQFRPRRSRRLPRGSIRPNYAERAEEGRGAQPRAPRHLLRLHRLEPGDANLLGRKLHQQLPVRAPRLLPPRRHDARGRADLAQQHACAHPVSYLNVHTDMMLGTYTATPNCSTYPRPHPASYHDVHMNMTYPCARPASIAT